MEKKTKKELIEIVGRYADAVNQERELVISLKKKIKDIEEITMQLQASKFRLSMVQQALHTMQAIRYPHEKSFEFEGSPDDPETIHFMRHLNNIVRGTYDGFREHP